MLSLQTSQSLPFDPWCEDGVLIRAIGFGRLMRWGAGALMLLLAHGLVAPSARAGCNDHLVTSQADRRLDFNRLDELITGDSADPDRAPRPCSGPGCSGGGPSAPASTASPHSGGPDQWVALAAAVGADVASPPRIAPDDPAARPDGHRPSIFHPPPA